jgi:hypothetical protein
VSTSPNSFSADRVQELGVEVAYRAGNVRLDGVEQPEQDGGGRLGGEHAGRDLRVDLVRVVPWPPAERAQGVGEQRFGRREYARDEAYDAGGTAGLTGVAADLGDRQPRREGRDAGYHRALDEQPGHDLAVLIEQLRHGRDRGDGHRREQHARRQEARDAGRDRAVRQVLRSVWAGRLPAGHRLDDFRGDRGDWGGWGRGGGRVARAGEAGTADGSDEAGRASGAGQARQI